MKRLVRISDGRDCGEYPDAHQPPPESEEGLGLIANPPTYRYDPVPPPSAEEVAEAQRKRDIEIAISGDATIAQLKAMTNAEFDTWWGANVTTAAQAIQVLKRLARVIIRRVV